MSTPIEIVLLGGPKECDGARFKIPSGMRHIKVPYTPGLRVENGPSYEPRKIGEPFPSVPYPKTAIYCLEEIRFDYSIQFVAVSVDLKIGDAGRRLVEFYGRPIA